MVSNVLLLGLPTCPQDHLQIIKAHPTARNCGHGHLRNLKRCINISKASCYLFLTGTLARKDVDNVTLVFFSLPKSPLATTIPTQTSRAAEENGCYFSLFSLERFSLLISTFVLHYTKSYYFSVRRPPLTTTTFAAIQGRLEH
jgi:hypothetical protein